MNVHLNDINYYVDNYIEYLRIQILDTVKKKLRIKEYKYYMHIVKFSQLKANDHHIE